MAVRISNIDNVLDTSSRKLTNRHAHQHRKKSLRTCKVRYDACEAEELTLYQHSPCLRLLRYLYIQVTLKLFFIQISVCCTMHLGLRSEFCASPAGFGVQVRDGSAQAQAKDAALLIGFLSPVDSAAAS